MLEISKKIEPLQNDILNILQLFEYQLNIQSIRQNIINEIAHLLLEANITNMKIEDISDDETTYYGHMLMQFTDMCTKESLTLHF